MSIFNKIMQGAAKAVTAPYIIADMITGGTSADHEYRAPLRSFERSSSRSSSESSSSSRDEGLDYSFFWSELNKRVFDEWDPDYEAALEQERDFHHFSQTYYPRKWLEQHGIWGAGAQSRYRQERYREHLRAERERRERSGKGKALLMVTLAALTIIGGIIAYYKCKGTSNSGCTDTPDRITLSEKTGIALKSTHQVPRTPPTLSERTGIGIKSTHHKPSAPPTLTEKTGILLKSAKQTQPDI